jgi:hypothetical protein
MFIRNWNLPTSETVKKLVPVGFLRLFGSCTLWLVLALILVDLATASVHPRRYITNPKYQPNDQNTPVTKIVEFIDCGNKPDAMVLGSSLPLLGIALADAAFIDGKQNEPETEVRVYGQARYLAKLLQEKFHHQVSTINLACYGQMASDADLIVTRTIEKGKCPKRIFYGIAPRDFIDNDSPECGRTPVYQALEIWGQNWNNPANTWKNLQANFNGKDSFEEKRDRAIAEFWHYFKVKGDWKALLVASAASTFNRPVTFAEFWDKYRGSNPDAEQGYAGTVKNSGNQLAHPKLDQEMYTKSLISYKKKYNPANYARFNQEVGHFKHLLSLCQQNNIELVVINMPITDANRNLIPANIYKDYLASISRLPAQFGATFVDLDRTKDFEANDFFDSVHVNAVGGKKVQDRLVAGLKSTDM